MASSLSTAYPSFFLATFAWLLGKRQQQVSATSLVLSRKVASFKPQHGSSISSSILLWPLETQLPLYSLPPPSSPRQQQEPFVEINTSYDPFTTIHNTQLCLEPSSKSANVLERILTEVCMEEALQQSIKHDAQ